tara:strand:- start:124 stop:681 length:558 start_codon:yes stop_codon:yes gene_type:complete
MLASYKFIQKLFLLNQKIIEISKLEKHDESDELSKFINQHLSKLEKNLNNFQYNVIIANIHEAYTFLIKIIDKGENFTNLITEYSKFLISITPVLPHFANECLENLNINKYYWPRIDEKFLIEDNVSIVVQFNGKKRGIINTKKDVLEEDLVKEILSSKTFEKFLKENTIKKKFYVKNRLINFLI